MDYKNRLIQALSDADRGVLQPLLTRAELPRGCELVAPQRPIEQAWFLESGLSSIIAMSGREQGVEVGLAGRDGLVGLPLLLDADRTPHRIFMQVEGVGYRIEANDLTVVLDKHQGIRKTLLRYVQAYATQTTYTAMSNAVDTVEARMARWLLMTHDRQDSDEISLTHEFLALMLGIQRPTVTLSLHSLEGMGLIKATRGLVKVRNRAGLEAFAGNAYGVPEAEYERLIGPLR